jgi:hypothetical protein
MEEDPDERWITTWNDYLWRIKYFFRWLYNIKKNENMDNFISPEPSNWTTKTLSIMLPNSAIMRNRSPSKL